MPSRRQRPEATPLIDLPPLARRAGTTTALVPIDADRCPACSSPTSTRHATQDALIRHAGYGESTRYETAACTNSDCRWRLDVGYRSERPPR